MHWLLALIFLAAPVLASAESASGTLRREPSTQNFDFYYPTNLSSTYGNLANGGALHLQSRFIWRGSEPGRIISEPQHAIVAFTNRGATNRMVNASGQMFWTHGVGAFVGERGLELELWFRDDPNQNGFDDEPSNAMVWSQADNRCVKYVLGNEPKDSLCLNAVPGAGSYLTPAPDFQLRESVLYWVRISIVPTNNPGWATLYADLVEEGAGPESEARVVQKGSIDFQIAKFFPMNWQPIEATIARTPGSAKEPAVDWIAFDFGF